jgi:hypothetical protein
MSAAFSVSSDSRMLAWMSGSISDSVSAAISLSMVSKIASRSSGLRSSTISAKSAGCISSSRRLSMFKRSLRCGSASRILHVLPADGVGANGALQAPHQSSRQNALEQPPEDAAHTDVDLKNIQNIGRRFRGADRTSHR